jgi:hypothetical protein
MAPQVADVGAMRRASPDHRGRLVAAARDGEPDGCCSVTRVLFPGESRRVGWLCSLPVQRFALARRIRSYESERGRGIWNAVRSRA